MSKWNWIYRWKKLDDLSREELYKIIYELGKYYTKYSELKCENSILKISKK